MGHENCGEPLNGLPGPKREKPGAGLGNVPAQEPLTVAASLWAKGK
jgi:hypothetical protein